MSDPVGQYHYQAWARRGVGASVTNPDSGTLPSRASLSVQLFLDVTDGTQPNPVLPPVCSVELFGPGDITGIDPRVIIRTEPRALTVNFEPNYLCGMEFDSPDFPWLFTPAAASGDRLHPWVALLVLKADEFQTPAVAPNPLPVIVVEKLAALPDLSVSWNWAHVQISGNASLADTLATAPSLAISRLLSPRRLGPETSYSAFLVPAFDVGVKVGLGLDVSTMTAAAPAWTTGTESKDPITLPYYYKFDFHTSDAGDFESLVRALTPRVLPPTVGQRSLDVDSTNPDLPLGGALQSVTMTPTTWTDPGKSEFQTSTQAVVNQTSPQTWDPANPGPDPIVVPPIYGRWMAGITSVDRMAAGWENDLNLDPRNRATAGMGTEVVQEERTALVASAWQQVDGIRQANQMLAQGQLARAASQQLYKQHLVAAPTTTLLTFTSPLHTRLLASPTTVATTIRASRVPLHMFSATFRRVTRGRSATLIASVNSGVITVTPPPQPPGGMTSVDQIPGVPASGAPRWFVILLIVALIIMVVLALAIGMTAALVALVIAALAAVVAYGQWSSSTTANPMTFSALTPQAIASVPARSDFVIVPAGTPMPTAPSASADSAQAAAFRRATSDVFAAYHALPSNKPMAPALDVARLSQTILQRVDPRVTVPARLSALITVGTRLGWKPVDPLEPLLVAPNFSQPMYAPLRDLDERYLLPGVEGVEPNTLGLLDQNQAFIEAYMVGLNHEMARQLLWQGYPTDQRGTYFRQFWDVSAYVPRPADPTTLFDIPPVTSWPLASALGSHPNRPSAAGNLVLLVRGELFKRYPNAIVYAGKAKIGPNGARVLDSTDERYPLFRGTLALDMTFLGFNLTPEDARGGTTNAPEGFFFVFQEQPSEPRFGLEPTPDISPVPHWADLAWTNFGSPDFLSPGTGPTATAIANDADNPNDTQNAWGVNGAQTAYILFRPPFRVLIHADLMLPQ
jgi:hypothetical protein